MGKKFWKKVEKDLSAEREKRLTPVAKELVGIVLGAGLPIGDYNKTGLDLFNDASQQIIQLMLDNDVKYVDKVFLFQLALKNEMDTILAKYVGKVEFKDKDGKEQVLTLNKETLASIILQPFELIKGIVISSLENSFNKVIDKKLGKDVLFVTLNDMDAILKEKPEIKYIPTA